MKSGTIRFCVAYHNQNAKGVIHLASTGYITVHAYTSYAQLPVQNVAVSVTAPDGTAIALRTTDRNGQIRPISIPVPDRSAGLTPNTGETPYTLVNLYARVKGFEQAEYENLQVFPDTVTNQNIELIPLSELPGKWNQTAFFDTPPQNL